LQVFKSTDGTVEVVLPSQTSATAVKLVPVTDEEEETTSDTVSIDYVKIFACFAEEFTTVTTTTSGTTITEKTTTAFTTVGTTMTTVIATTTPSAPTGKTDRGLHNFILVHACCPVVL